jgi:hypothetical protein
MEASKLVAIRPCLDEAVRRIETYLKSPQKFKESVEATAALWAASRVPLDEIPEPPMPTGYLNPGKLDPWGCACNWWPTAARVAAGKLHEAGETFLAKAIHEQLETLPDYVDHDRSQSQHEVAQKAALHVKDILEAIRPGGHPTPPAITASTAADAPKPEAFQAHWLSQNGYSQQRIAEMLLGSESKQGTISKWLAKVERWRMAGNKMPDLQRNESLDRKPATIDPAKLDWGARSDHRTPRQAEKLAGITGHDSGDDEE